MNRSTRPAPTPSRGSAPSWCRASRELSQRGRPPPVRGDRRPGRARRRQSLCLTPTIRPAMDIAANLEQIRAAIAAACARSQRDPASVRLVAVSKTHPPAAVQAAQAAGQTLFGENYVQEFLAKAESVAPPVEWHFLGHLQSNKVKALAGKVTLIHSLDRLSLAEEIDRQWGRLGARANALIEVNLGGETSKAGVDADGLEPLLRRLAALPHLAVHGLMLLPLQRRPRGGAPVLPPPARAGRGDGRPGTPRGEHARTVDGDEPRLRRRHRGGGDAHPRRHRDLRRTRRSMKAPICGVTLRRVAVTYLPVRLTPRRAGALHLGTFDRPFLDRQCRHFCLLTIPPA
ncbi:MAG: YggS family pyridoxal phosphate-dependent enzyme [Desulfomicrobium escambiense]|nr:YggS family pyridoxal phosphate-dependent enzyme [Desulfomicrobium escambiense]